MYSAPSGLGELYPFAGVDDNRLACLNVKNAGLRGYTQFALKHHRIFLELRRRSRLEPASKASHPRNAHPGRRGIDAPDVLFDDLGFAATLKRRGTYRRTIASHVPEYSHDVLTEDYESVKFPLRLLRRGSAIDNFCAC